MIVITVPKTIEKYAQDEKNYGKIRKCNIERKAATEREEGK